MRHRLAPLGLAAALLLVSACGSSGPRYPDQAPLGHGTIFFRSAGGFDPGDTVQVTGRQYGRCGRATYLGFWTSPGIQPFLPIYAVEWPDHRREAVSSARVRRYGGAPAGRGCRN